MNDRIKSAKYFGIDRWPKLRASALRAAMMECQKSPSFRDSRYLERIKNRWSIGPALAFYVSRPELYW